MALSYGLVLKDVICDNSSSYQGEAEPMNPQKFRHVWVYLEHKWDLAIKGPFLKETKNASGK